MPALKEDRRRSCRRLWVLLAVALAGYEVLVYRHWLHAVPLLPSRVVDLQDDQHPIGFVGSNLFALARRPPVSINGRQAFGPVELHEYPGEGTRKILSADDAVRIGSSLDGEPPFMFNEWGPLFRFRSEGSHPVMQSELRKPDYLVLDDQRLLHLTEGVLHCQDATTGRDRWRRDYVRYVHCVCNDVAYVALRDPDSPPDSVDTESALLDLTNGRIIQRLAFEDTSTVADISRDRQWAAFVAHDGIEVWSIPENRRAWHSEFTRTGTKTLVFSPDSKFLVGYCLDQSGLQRVCLRSSDGARVGLPANAISPSSWRSSGEILGQRYALFREKKRFHSGLPFWLEMLLARVGVSPAPSNAITDLVYDTQTAELIGCLDATRSMLFQRSDRDVFALFRTSPAGNRLEFYDLPPRSDWTWWILHALILPIPVIAVATRLHRRELAGSECEPARIADDSQKRDAAAGS